MNEANQQTASWKSVVNLFSPVITPLTEVRAHQRSRNKSFMLNLFTELFMVTTTVKKTVKGSIKITEQNLIQEQI